jgi:hypothetical protein
MPQPPAPLAVEAMAQTLGANLQVFRSLFLGLDPAALRWKATPQTWSLLETLI